MAFHGSTGNVLFQADTGCVILRPGYRIQQFLTALGFHREPIEEVVLRAYLGPAQVELFQSMSVSEQRHAFAVLHRLQREGYDEAVLAQAALLHDAGKLEGRIRLWHRVVTVLVQAVHPALLRRLALNEPHSWRYPFFVQLHHNLRGAELAARTGTDPVAVALIRWHHTAPEESDLDPRGQALLMALKSADEEN